MYEGACGVASSWSKDGDMVYIHHSCLRGLCCPYCMIGGGGGFRGANVVVMLTKQLVAFVTQGPNGLG